MLRNMETLSNYKIFAKDGVIGKVHDFLFDDSDWAVKYMVIDIGGWLPGRKVLVSPSSFSQPDPESKKFPVSLTKAQIERSPEVNLDRPVSRQYLNDLSRYYGWPMYTPGRERYPSTTGRPSSAREQARAGTAVLEAEEELRLLSTKSVEDYSILATDGNIGHVEDFVMDDQNWTIRYMVIDTTNWLPGRKVLISPEFAKGIDLRAKELVVKLDKNTIKNSPEYDHSKPIIQEYEARLRNYYTERI